jgi:ABC-type bacteriocin/lantibiotic exporter with double-glycine peptidase domain
MMVLLTILNVLPGLIVKDIFDVGIVNMNYTRIIAMCFALVIIYTIISVLNYKSTFILGACSNVLVTNVRDDVVSKTMKLPMDFFSMHESGYVTSRIGEVSGISSLLSVSTMKSIISLFQFIGVSVVLFSINPLLTFALLAITPLFFILGRRNTREMVKASERAVEQSARLNSKIQESMQGIEEVKNLSVEENEAQKIKRENGELLKLSIKQTDRYTLGIETLAYLGKLMSVFLIAMGGYMIAKNTISLGDYMTFSTYLGMLYAPMQSLAVLSISLSPAIVSLGRIMDFMNEINEDETDANKKVLDKITSIEFINVDFKYSSQNCFAVKNINFLLEDRDKLMIKGENGSGKTTILRLILALYNPTRGKILVNGTNELSYKRSGIRGRISIVSQKVYVFSGTVEENIIYGTGLSPRDAEAMINKLKITGILEQVSLQKQIIVQGNTCNLSGGQIQRIALARGILKGSDVFLFDESTSGLDDEGVGALKRIVTDVLSEKICVFVEHGNELDVLCNKTITI